MANALKIRPLLFPLPVKTPWRCLPVQRWHGNGYVDPVDLLKRTVWLEHAGRQSGFFRRRTSALH
jgi:hypothetical protein